MQKENKAVSFSIDYNFFDETQETELKMIIDGENILSFNKNNQKKTTRWNLDELAMWLRNFIDSLCEDPYPVEVDGEYASIKDVNAREFDSEDDKEFDEYYDRLDEWNSRHRWHTASHGAILADLYFQLVGDFIEVSWDNQDAEEGVVFDRIIGGIQIPKELFCAEVDLFLKEYAKHWFQG